MIIDTLQIDLSKRSCYIFKNKHFSTWFCMNIMFNQLETKDPEGFLSLYQVKRDKMDQFLKLLQLFQV